MPLSTPLLSDKVQRESYQNGPRTRAFDQGGSESIRHAQEPEKHRRFRVEGRGITYQQ